MNMKYAKAAKRTYLLKNLILLTVLLVSMVAVALAWFANFTDANVSGMSISMYAGEHLKISLQENGSYDYSVNLSEKADILQNLNLAEVTGDGRTLYTPVAQTADTGVLEPDTTQTWAAAEPGTDYIEFDLYLRADVPVEVYLGAGSVLTPRVGNDNLTWDYDRRDTSSYHPSSYGRFSRDAIAGAARVAVTHTKENTELNHFVWLPRPDLYLNTEGAEWFLNTDSHNTDFSSDNLKNSYKHVYYTLNTQSLPVLEANAGGTNPNVVTVLSATQGIRPQGGDHSQILTISEKDDDGYYYDSIKIKIWLEACDAEARRALLSGEFDIEMALMAYEQTP